MYRDIPFQAKKSEAIVVPREFAHTAPKALHHMWNHPNKSQMRQKFQRQFFILDEGSILTDTFDWCEYPCQADLKLPKETLKHHTDTKAIKVGSHFSADVMEDNRQRILILRENLTSYSVTKIIPDQTKSTLKSGLIVLASSVRMEGSLVIRTNGHSSLKSLVSDPQLSQLGITIEVGHVKNINKNPVAEKSISELRQQIRKLQPGGGQ